MGIKLLSLNIVVKLLAVFYVFMYRDEFNLNNNSGHSKQNSSNQLLAVQTPANDFTINSKNVGCCSYINRCFMGLHYRLLLILGK